MIKLVSVNIERSKHLERVVPFLRSQQADVVCVQELMEYDVPQLESVAGTCFYTATSRHPAEGKEGIFGLGIFSKIPIRRSRAHFYHGTGVPERVFDVTSVRTKRETESYAVAFVECEKDNGSFTISTTHFTWTPNGRPDRYQRADMQKLLAVLDGEKEFVLGGDFNAPRGGEIFAMLAEKYKDNIPSHYTTSIDKDLHRAGDLQLMVDGLFSTSDYKVSSVELHSGVSDHMAITATIQKTMGV